MKKYLILLLLVMGLIGCDIYKNFTLEKGAVPEFFGEDSIKLHREIEKTIQAIEAIDKSFRGSQLEKYPRELGRGSSSNYIEGALRKDVLERLPDLQKAEIRKNIEFYFVDIETGKVSASEKEINYWKDVLDNL